MIKKIKPIKAHISKSYKERIKEESVKRNMNLSDFTTMVIEEYLNKIPPHKLPYTITLHDTISARLTEETWLKLKAKCEFEKMSISEYIRIILYDYIRKINKGGVNNDN